MSTHDRSAGSRTRWLRTAAALAVAGVVTLGSGGLVLASAGSAAADAPASLEKIGVMQSVKVGKYLFFANVALLDLLRPKPKQ